MPSLYLVDVSSIFYRAFFALPPLTNGKGLPTNALYGFLSMTLKLVRTEKPDFIAFCFDNARPSFRNVLYADYKANREEAPDDLAVQFPYLRLLCQELGVAIFDQEGFEADDLIGTLTRLGREQDWEVVIVSGDKDFAQLVSNKVYLYDTMKEKKFDAQAVFEKWGVRPEQMRDYLALVGDTSDNVPGVKGVGPKGAIKLLTEFGTLEGIYENLAKVSGAALKIKLETGRESAFLAQKLVSIHQDVPISWDVEKLRTHLTQKESLKQLLLELGFKSFAKTLVPDLPESNISNSNNLSEKKISAQSWSVLDVEKELDPYAEVWLLIYDEVLALGVGKNVYRIEGTPTQLGEVLNKKKISWLGFDLKMGWHKLKLKEPVVVWDNLMAAYVLRAGSYEAFNQVYDKFNQEPLDPNLTLDEFYRAQMHLKKILDEKLHQQNIFTVYQDLELPLIPVLYAMEKQGIRLDTHTLREQGEQLTQDITKLEQQIYVLTGEKFNIASPKQLSQVLFEKMKLPTSKKTKSGFSTDSEVLEQLDHPVGKVLLEYRELTKLKSTYVEALPSLVQVETQCLHTHFNQAGTTTGRLSSQNPNLQNIPIRTERGRKIRQAFVAPENEMLISADYSQIELRILAHITEDPALCKAFADDMDIHAATASEIFSIPLNQVNAEKRRIAKAVNFGIAYGQGAFGLAETLGVSRQESAEIIEKYFSRFVQVKQYMEDTVALAYKQGYVETLFGRRRYIEELKSKNMSVKKFGERVAINSPIQGTASDLVKKVMLKLHWELSIPMLLQVHDELIFSAPIVEIEEQETLIKKHMENIVQFKVPLKVNIAHGYNWEDAHR
ncbi:MAG: DNA polymerase I [Bdellovibrionales bacterium]|nr:DNA polymerase I [Bdellovibrionales bacterium]